MMESNLINIMINFLIKYIDPNSFLSYDTYIWYTKAWKSLSHPRKQVICKFFYRLAIFLFKYDIINYILNPKIILKLI